jgi:hypothetical protein
VGRRPRRPKKVKTAAATGAGVRRTRRRRRGTDPASVSGIGETAKASADPERVIVSAKTTIDPSFPLGFVSDYFLISVT